MCAWSFLSHGLIGLALIIAQACDGVNSSALSDEQPTATKHLASEHFAGSFPLPRFQHARLRKLSHARSLTTGQRRPRIYIQEMPDRFTQKANHGNISNSFWGLESLFFNLLRNSPYIASSPAEADYIAPEIWFHYTQPQPQEVLDALNGSTWDTAPQKYLFVITSEHARCDYVDPRFDKAIFLSHFGHLFAREHNQFGKECDLLTQYGDECDLLFKAGSDAFHLRPFTPCFKSKHDIVVPPACYEDSVAAEPAASSSGTSTAVYGSRYTDVDLAKVQRNHTLFFSGVIDIDANEYWAKDRPWSDAFYSFGVRQTVSRMHGHKPGFMILPEHTLTPQQYWQTAAASHFCLAPPAWGWGTKVKAAATRGCIPLIIQDGIMVEWEEQLPLKDYALRLPLWSAHKLPDILETYVKTGWAAEMQAVMEKCAWRLHWWRHPHGRAFDVLMCELKRRALGASAMKADLHKCTLECGDGQVVNLLEGHYQV